MRGKTVLVEVVPVVAGRPFDRPFDRLMVPFDKLTALSVVEGLSGVEGLTALSPDRSGSKGRHATPTW